MIFQSMASGFKDKYQILFETSKFLEKIQTGRLKKDEGCFPNNVRGPATGLL